MDFQKLEGTWRTIIIQHRHPASGSSPRPTGARTDTAAERILRLEQENQEFKNQVEMHRLTIIGSEEELTLLREMLKADEVA